ncbi:serine hydrolase domain-containing protein [Albibacterium indicum]|uniref:serine hydrolase domain-containing protein n=1 Tax=Albibacterium indicum TaxID=2292082 RepID=UPI000E485115|nr:serine hydrolase [Pedobacter indicus]
MKRRTICILLTIFSAHVFAQKSKPSDAAIKQTEKEIHSIMEQFDAIGIAVAVVKDQDIIYSNNFGYRNLETQEPLETSDIFRIASISKSFSATAVMQLVEQGKASLDDDLSELIGFKVRNPRFPNTIITLRMALSHTSSISDSEGYFNLDIINPNKNPDWASSYNDYEPGTDYEYCNLGFNMIGTIIERISGERFDKHIKKTILDPLRLYGGYNVNALDSNRFVTLYSYDPDTKKFTPSPSAYAPRSEEIANYTMGYSTPVFSPTGGMKISAIDLAKYMTMHMHFGSVVGTKIISEESAKIMQTPVAIEDGYGLALLKSSDLIDGVTLTGHTGSAYGLYSAMFFNPDEKYGFIVVTNGINIPPTDDVNTFQKAIITSLYTNLIHSK